MKCFCTCERTCDADLVFTMMEITSATAKEGGFLISGYGDCSGERRPVIRASDWVPLDNWTRTSDSDAPIYARPWTGATIKRLFADGLPVLAARCPEA